MQEVKSYPIIFSSLMLLKLLAFRKTQTRRVIKLPRWSTGDWEDFGTDGAIAETIAKRTGCLSTIRCPYGKAGDTLWVRETWAKGANPDRFYYKASESIPPSMQWKAPIHMPRVASRFTLGVKSIRIERVEDISTEDAQAEGFESASDFICFFYQLNPEAINKNPWVWAIEFFQISE